MVSFIVVQVLRNATLVIGRRTDVPIRNRTLYKATDVPEVAKLEGKLYRADGMDYFAIAGNRFPWHLVPNLVIGRRLYDNFLVAIASLHDIFLVDATCTVVALHQTDYMGIGSGQRNIDFNYNRRRIGYKIMYRGCTSTTCTKYLTVLEIDEVQQTYNTSSITRINNIHVVPRYRQKNVWCTTNRQISYNTQ